MTEIFKNIEGLEFILNCKFSVVTVSSNPVKQEIFNMQFFI